MKHCDCCERDVDEGSWDGLYGVCAGCAWCQSLEHWPCCHSECRADELILPREYAD